VGNGWIREAIEEGQSVEEIQAQWQEDLNEFKELRENYLLY
ncbi:exo-beta-N-acetylmuramidase NamZ domain-containing protein, partial [Halobacillus sp. BBL2006]